MVNDPCPPSAGTEAVLLAGANVGAVADATCVTVFVTLFGKAVPEPAVVTMVPVRTAPVVFADAVTAMLPLPEVPDVERESQLSDFTALQEVLAVTAMLADPPADAKETLVGLVESETSMFPQSLPLNAVPAEFTASIQYQYFTPGVSPFET